LSDRFALGRTRHITNGSAGFRASWTWFDFRLGHLVPFHRRGRAPPSTSRKVRLPGLRHGIPCGAKMYFRLSGAEEKMVLSSSLKYRAGARLEDGPTWGGHPSRREQTARLQDEDWPRQWPPEFGICGTWPISEFHKFRLTAGNISTKRCWVPRPTMGGSRIVTDAGRDAVAPAAH